MIDPPPIRPVRPRLLAGMGHGARAHAASLAIVLLLAVALLELVTVRYRELNRENERLITERATARAVSLSSLLANSIAATLGQIEVDHSLAKLVTEARLAGNRDAEAALRRYVDPASSFASPDIAEVSGVDPNGRLFWSNLSANAAPIDVSDREHVRVLIDDPSREHFLGRPLVSRTTGEWVIPDARAVRGPDGALLALTNVLWRVNALARLCADLGLDKDDRVMLVRDDGVVMMSTQAQRVGTVYPEPKAADSTRRDLASVWLGPSPIDGELRYHARQRIAGAPLTLQVGLSMVAQEAALAGVRATLWRWTAFLDAAIIVVALAGGVVLILGRRSALQAVRAAALAENEAWFRGVFDEMADGILVFEGVTPADFRATYANRRAGEIFGVPAPELTGQRAALLIHPDERDRLAGRRQALFAGGSADVVTYRAMRSDGRDILLATSSVSFRPRDDPSKIRVVTSIRDVTAERQRDAALAEARAQIDRMLAVVPGVFYRAAVAPGEPAKPLFVSESAKTLFGIEVADAMRPGFLAERIGVDLTAVRLAALERAAPSPIASVEYPAYPAGREIWLRDTFHRIVRPDGGHELVGFIADVTTRRAAEENLRAAVQFGPGLLYHARVTEAGVEVLRVHGDAARITGAFVGEDGGPARLDDLLGPAERIDELRSLSADASMTTVYALQGGGAETRWLRNAVRVTSRAGDSIEVVGYVLDVTREKEEQLHLQKVTTLLTLGEMATGMAHELNQPLSSISFAAQNAELRLARQPLDMPALAAKLDKIVQEARRASKLVEHMRIFARNEREELRPVPWRAVLEAAEEMLRPRLRGCTLAVALPDDLPDVMGAPIPMEQVLLNLILNAVDAYDGTAPDAPRRVTVQGRVESGAVVLRVADRAGGIPAHLLSRVFEPFFTTKPPGQGTGLGLALCFGTIVEMGGTITAANEDGGAVFEIRLPPAVAGAEGASDAPARRAG